MTPCAAAALAAVRLKVAPGDRRNRPRARRPNRPILVIDLHQLFKLLQMCDTFASSLSSSTTEGGSPQARQRSPARTPGTAMKCLYYLSPNLETTQQISNDLQEVGVLEWFLHVISKDEAGLKREQIQSSNYLETTDIIREGLIGANLGFIAAVVAAGLVMLLEPFGSGTPKVVYFFVIVVFTLFGAWVGGLTGIEKRNKKLGRFQKDIEAGKYLVLIYARKDQEQVVRGMMKEKHGEAQLAAVDRQFLNPFGSLRRKRKRRAARSG
jgi:hypothetical protein